MIGAPAAALKMLFGTNPNKGYKQNIQFTGGSVSDYSPPSNPNLTAYKTKDGRRGVVYNGEIYYDDGAGKFKSHRGPDYLTYNTRSSSPPPSGGSTYYPPSSSGGSGLLDYRESLPSSNIGPYPRPNKYFPLLTQAYDRPEARDYSEFIQAGNPFGGDGGLLYQPWSQQYSEQYGLPDKIAQYQPNIFGVGRVGYYGAPFGSLNITPPEEIFASPMEEMEEPIKQDKI